ncbi:hypothetical protein SAMN05443429_105158 [Cruoricaptor ignavus]|uniref:ASCH domain-containing protein n=1 Tax=Cruoricaptor ignavus TaxID=1118202 RepID=A0A1M6EMG3_9FLAO|nr:hypothetical protein [Cruoricaptor ignavus]SHI86691.1 hypothetical protein SAMN05443429_105158 [Cruoricaptor ignavus]
MNYSENLKKKIDELNLSKENILYLPIARVHLRRIVDGSKTVEFRDLTDYYLKKINNYKNLQYDSTKPITHILFQGGYNADSPRVLAELKYTGAKFNANKDLPDEFIIYSKGREVIAMSLEEGEANYPNIFREAEIEGFENGDEYLALQLGRVVYTEGI